MSPGEIKNTDLHAAKEFFEGLKFSKIVIELNGDLGSGKTQFVRWGLETLTQDDLASATYSLINEYQTSRGPVQHLDLYRIEHFSELEPIGFWDLFETDQLILIEWANRFGQISYPADWAVITLNFTNAAGVFQFERLR